MTDEAPETMPNNPCTFCRTNNLTLMQHQREVPFFGKVLLFSMTCSNCKYHKADVELLEKNEPAKWTIVVENEEDLKTRVIKSSQATVKIPHIMTIEPGEAANGYVSNVEGILRRVKHQLETARDGEDDNTKKKKLKNMLKKLQKVMWGQEKLTITIEDPTGNSAIVSEKAEMKKIKGKKK